jgi:hypothetical protein
LEAGTFDGGGGCSGGGAGGGGSLTEIAGPEFENNPIPTRWRRIGMHSILRISILR